MDSLDLKLLNHLQEHGEIDLSNTKAFNRSEGSIYRRIDSINAYLSKHQQLVPKNHKIQSKMTYKEYIQIVQSIPFYAYIPSQQERLSFIIVQSILKEVVNTSRLYQHLGLSMSTKKKDNRHLTKQLKQAGLCKEIVRKKGIRISGQETLIRIEAAKILVKLFELDKDNKLYLRQANNPMEVLIAEYFLTETNFIHNQVKNLIETIIYQQNIELSYPSKKFIFLYAMITFYRNHLGYYESKKIHTTITFPSPFKFVKHSMENQIFNHILFSLDTMNKESNVSIQIQWLEEKVTQFISVVQSNIITDIYSKHELFQEMYQFIFKCILRSDYRFDFYDNKLDQTAGKFPNLYHLIEQDSFISNELQLSSDQIATLTLIFRKHINENKILGRNTKSIVIVTNSSIEKADFFGATLNHYLDIKIVKTLHINELHALAYLDYDYVLTFSNRIATLIEEQGYTCLKVKFYINDDDINMLLQIGFSSSSRRKILAEEIVPVLQGKTADEMKEYLIKNYPSHFL
ncbi:helix-turn-helix domain-containing protein [Oceanobacillus sp. CFH 90083]|uniref:helix-turn-helix domain-containing protein n=1 Tax=Oceanobacillus sp. CFH 90083 TaxID=2592336 RepID=UPI00128BE7DC|nr:helix-turn-helix domain-containing protein [Oceanobacillus sp. CFH 90083]